MPELVEDTGINREEVALLFGCHDADEGMRTFSEAATDIPYSMRTDSETGSAEYRLSDIETIVLDWKGIKRAERRPMRSNAPAPTPLQLSDDDGTLTAILLADNGGKGGAAAYSVTQVAERCGLEEGELQRRLVLGGAKLEVVDGRMLAAKADVQRLIGSGSIPDPAKREEESKPRTPDPDPLSPAIDGEAERRTAEVAKRMGIELEAKLDTSAESEPVTTPDATTQRASAKPRSRTRIGAPRRWGQR
ncbi:MAG TPA: hypothetical protein VH275_04615 [Solirubrobacterales bacterium]|jgi:ATP-dependent DNA ligase|nr:hypothetical protein [Solirubrobacterales bacterium]